VFHFDKDTNEIKTLYANAMIKDKVKGIIKANNFLNSTLKNVN